MFWLFYSYLFPLFLFTVIPGIPAVILCVKFPNAAPKLIAVIATVLAIFSLITIGNPAISYFSFMLLSAVSPILYCAAFLNKKKKNISL